MYNVTVYLQNRVIKNFNLAKVVNFQITGKSIISESGVKFNFDSNVRMVKGVWNV